MNDTAILASIGILIGCNTESTITITFDPMVNGEPLEYGKKYAAPNGDGTFYITDFMFYVSNIRLSNDDGSDYVEKNSYHLIKFENGSGHSIILDSVDARAYGNLELSIGIDSVANNSAVPRGDLDPTNPMAWNWTTGYKFILLEGKYNPGAGRSIPLVYHIGFSENRKELSFVVPSSGHIHLKVEINKLFTQPNPIDFHIHPEILFNQEHAAMLAANYAQGFVELE